METFFTPTRGKMILTAVLVILAVLLLFGGPYGIFCKLGSPCPQPIEAKVLSNLAFGLNVPFYLVEERGNFWRGIGNALGGPQTVWWDVIHVGWLIVGFVLTLLYLYAISCIVVYGYKKLRNNTGKRTQTFK